VTDHGRATPADLPRGFDGHRRAQAGLGLRLTPAERLRWLEETMAALRRWRGRARAAIGGSSPDTQRPASGRVPEPGEDP
jgi:hypothetical protein